MCRLFGLLGGGPSVAERYLVASERSLLAQSNVSAETLQPDGWGIAWRSPGEPLHLEKGTGGAYDPAEAPRFRRAAAAARGSLVVGHLRQASNPMGLPHSRLIGVENSQPFALDRLLFAHNGAIPLPRETRPYLGTMEPKVQGVNDSEVLFLLLAHHLDGGADPPTAYGRAIHDLVAVWESKGRPTPEPYSGLNLLLSRHPEELWAFCHWRGEHGTGFFDPARAYYEMGYRADAQHLLVGSEPFDARTDWRPLRNGEYLEAHLAHGLLAIETGRLDLPVVRAAGPPR